jgi:hypothetical protein
MKTAMAALLLAFPAFAQNEAPLETRPAEATARPPAPAEPTGCGRWKAEGLGEGPIALGYGEADVATGRRACPRTEVGIGGRFAAIIDTPNYYGNLVVDGLVFGSVAINPKTEIFGTLAAVEWNWVQNATLKGSALTLGTLTLGATRQFYGDDRFLGAFSARLMLPTSLVTPNSKQFGVEVGHASTWRPRDWLEVHGYLGADFNTGIGLGPSLPRFGGVLTAGAQFSPVGWAALVVDATGRLGPKSYFAPTFALRFRVFSLGIELAATLPVAGTDRHDFIMGGRFTWRI